MLFIQDEIDAQMLVEAERWSDWIAYKLTMQFWDELFARLGVA